jgi:hypothetical protein
MATCGRLKRSGTHPIKREIEQIPCFAEVATDDDLKIKTFHAITAPNLSNPLFWCQAR